MIDVIVPVYRGLEETRACLESVWQSENTQPMRLLVINDASPEPELTDWLRQQATQRPMLLLENELNLGFVATVNRGMSYSDSHDIVLLNSDTEVNANWLDRLYHAAYSAPDIATVTPFSNNATICSYPTFCQDNALPAGLTLAKLDALFSEANSGNTLDIPTAVGFCMYIRRSILQKVGLFDVEHFGKGYGEENDFCCRVIKHGYRNVLAADVFVWHKGNVSFGDSHNDRKQLALETLQQLHPEYLPRVHNHLMADPAREARLRVDFLRWHQPELLTLPKLLFITHSRGGGTEHHCRELADHLVGRALVFKLCPHPGGMTELSAYSRGEAATFYFQLPTDYKALIKLLGLIGISRVHVHHTLSLDSMIRDIARDLGVAQDFTAHDYYTICPQITLTGADNRYCGEEGIEQCAGCLKKQPASGHSITTWRASFRSLLESSERVIAPTPFVAQRLSAIFGLKNLLTVEHPDALSNWADSVKSPYCPPGREIRVAVLGALSPMKGPDLLEETALDAKNRNLPIRFKLFGYAYRDLQLGEHLEVHGAYRKEELSGLLNEWKPDLVWFPAQWPETYSYTLSECFILGLPVLVSDLGALADRIAGRPYSWKFPWNASAQAWNEQIIELAANSPPESAYFKRSKTTATFYDQYYLSTLNNNTRQSRLNVPSEEVLRTTRLRPLTSGQSMRLRILGVIVGLRTGPGFSWLARKIPLSIQRRLKNRLLGHPPT